ncbi:telomere-binding alpha subunit central domain protein [Cordyceps militaris CM01]|uniref:Telomere-binding alpha subunit central domain protein n=1 Tax=Cordyceps militaris (strain CM01) TaxID=983644 RepID=G3JKK4_CORMM|nr:telomere-binding alpha subunit central domain protein [Cordyceps militaris CM01]EGX91443.1 telomere-binding alpha subunit central domain protein [Cordyceps militaris CM01]
MASAVSSFTPIDRVLDGHITPGTLINLIGLVTDFRTPIPTRKTGIFSNSLIAVSQSLTIITVDYKAEIRFYDESTQHDSSKSLNIHMFRQPDAMPIPSLGDVVVIFKAKVQFFQSEYSLMTHYLTDVYVFTASRVPRPPQDAQDALHSKSLGKTPKSLTKADLGHVSAFYHRIDKERVPTTIEYNNAVASSGQIKEKSSLLKDASVRRFVDVIAEVVKTPYDDGEKFTLWISDYTEHSNFFNFAIKSLESHTRSTRNYNGDSRATEADWAGPYGKRSMQITCWEPHAEAIRTNKITLGSWVAIRNLQIKFGRNSSNLEGFLRGDQRYPNRVYISKLDYEVDGDSMDPKFKDTIRRRRDYEKEMKKQLKSISEAASAGQKRRAALDEDQTPRSPNSKAKRSKKRKNAEKSKKNIQNPEKENPSTPEPDVAKIKLNSTIKCENEKQPLSTVAELLEQFYFETLIGKDAAKLPLPFTNANYRATVRVTDYLPHSLADFAFPKRKTGMYHALSSDGESEPSEGGDDEQTMDRHVTSEKIVGWEWRFHLLLEDAQDPDAAHHDKVWVTVDNHAAQCLLSMNACDLRNSKAVVARLREKLFYLWGDLEEKKTARLQRREKVEKQARANGPPVDSDDEEAASAAAVVPANRPFSCCIRQYGIKMREEDEGKADAGEKKRWQRMYGLFGTQISVPDMARAE